LFSHIDANGRPKMVGVTAKPETLRSAKASCFLRASATTLEALKSKRLPKGDALTVAQVAGIQAAKLTPHLIPLCHSLSAGDISVDISVLEAGVKIVSRVEAIAATGPEMEALVACTVAALTLYDMCKSMDPSMVIDEVRLEAKTGGKSGHHLDGLSGKRAVILTLSDRASRGIYQDLSGPVAREALKKIGFELAHCEIIPDELDLIAERLLNFCENLAPDLILTLGGTGLSHRDVAPEATERVIDRKIPGIAEMLRAQSFAKHPTSSFLSRAVAGLKSKTLIVNLPGKPAAVSENLNLLIPAFDHIFRMISGEGHESKALGQSHRSVR